ncbi:MAG: hypothetical protein K9N49_01710 [Candidatus Marinimicrobia bacterium]|nr:hypothetical protein [Candidatus Neomarinimicrobiota bacterium]
MKAIYWVGVCLALVLSAGAQGVPESFNYQGVLRGGSGEYLEAGTYNVMFKLYPVATGGAALWGREYAVSLDTNGLFNVELADGTGSEIIPDSSLAATTSANETLYLGLTVEGSTEIAPRQQLLSVPYALRAGDVNQASADFTVTGTLDVLGGAEVRGTLQAFDAIEVGNPGTGIARLTVVDETLAVHGTLQATNFVGHGTVPLGAILMWSGTTNNIPEGWALCNGQNGTPDLRDRFIVGAGNQYALSDTGGVTTVTLSTDQLPPHGHAYKDGYFAESSISDYLDGVDSLSKHVTGSGNHDKDNDHIPYRNLTTLNTGSGNPVHTLPPYYAVFYIMRVH